MHKIIFVVVVIVCACVTAAPANNEQLDKANANNPYVNDVIASNKAKLQDAVASAGVSAKQEEATTHGNIEFNPKPAGTALVRLIDDIFQIPIGVLQSVAKLLTNPFKQILHPTSTQTLTKDGSTA